MFKYIKIVFTFGNTTLELLFTLAIVICCNCSYNIYNYCHGNLLPNLLVEDVNLRSTLAYITAAFAHGCFSHTLFDPRPT